MLLQQRKDVYYEYFFLTNTPLFHGISENEISELLSCLGAKERKFKKDEIVLFENGELALEVNVSPPLVGGV